MWSQEGDCAAVCFFFGGLSCCVWNCGKMGTFFTGIAFGFR